MKRVAKKTLKQVLLAGKNKFVLRSKSDAEFVAKHPILRTDDANGNGDEVFTASNVKRDSSKAAPKGDAVAESFKIPKNYTMIRLRQERKLRQQGKDRDKRGNDNPPKNYQSSSFSKQAAEFNRQHPHLKVDESFDRHDSLPMYDAQAEKRDKARFALKKLKKLDPATLARALGVEGKKPQGLFSKPAKKKVDESIKPRDFSHSYDSRTFSQRKAESELKKSKKGPSDGPYGYGKIKELSPEEQKKLDDWRVSKGDWSSRKKVDEAFKGVVSLKHHGAWAEVGTTHRNIVKGNSDKALHKHAAAYAKGQPYRLEVFHQDRIYGKPLRTLVKETLDEALIPKPITTKGRRRKPGAVYTPEETIGEQKDRVGTASYHRQRADHYEDEAAKWLGKGQHGTASPYLRAARQHAKLATQIGARQRKSVMRAREVSEEAVNELSKRTLANYIGSASIDKSHHASNIGGQNALGVELDRPRDKSFHTSQRKHGERSFGIQVAAHKLAAFKKGPFRVKVPATEETISEVSKDLLKRYIHHAVFDVGTTMHATGAIPQEKFANGRWSPDPRLRDSRYIRAGKRQKGINLAAGKLAADRRGGPGDHRDYVPASEEVVNELSTKLLNRYSSKSRDSIATIGDQDPSGFRTHSRSDNQKERNRNQGLNRARRKIAFSSEEVEVIDETDGPHAKARTAQHDFDYVSRKNHDRREKAYAKKYPTYKPVSLLKKKKDVKEETIDEKRSMADHKAAAATYSKGRNGAELSAYIKAHGLSEADANKVRDEYIKRRERLKLKEQQTIDELSTSTLSSYLKKSQDSFRLPHRLGVTKTEYASRATDQKTDNRVMGMYRAANKVEKKIKEEALEEGNVHVRLYQDGKDIGSRKMPTDHRDTHSHINAFLKHHDVEPVDRSKMKVRIGAKNVHHAEWLDGQPGDAQYHMKATATYSGKDLKEESLDELSKKTLKSYLNRSEDDEGRAKAARSVMHVGGEGSMKMWAREIKRSVGQRYAKKKIGEETIEEASRHRKALVAHINDIVHSTHKKFAGKSRSERVRMGLHSFSDAKKD